MPPVDIVILIVVLLSAIIGLIRGFLREVLSLVAWVTALLLALHFSPRLAETLAGTLSNDAIRLVAAFAAIFVAVLILASLLQWLVGKLINATGMSGTDRFLGFLFGSFRGVLLCIVIVIGLRPFVETTDWWRSSALIPELTVFEGEAIRWIDCTISAVESISTKP